MSTSGPTRMKVFFLLLYMDLRFVDLSVYLVTSPTKRQLVLRSAPAPRCTKEHGPASACRREVFRRAHTYIPWMNTKHHAKAGAGLGI